MTEEITIDFSRKAPPKPKSLTPSQIEARDTPGSVFCFAPPGGGKTEVLTQRAERLVNEGRKPLCLTFTIVAAEEMRHRIPEIEARTIHSYCYKNVGWVGGYIEMLEKFIEKPYKQKWTDVLVDEAQDLSPLQWEVIKSIPKIHRFVVGDPYQSIYIGDWVGPEDRLKALGKRVLEEVKELKEVKLVENFRSNGYVVNLLEKIYPRGLIAKGPKDFGTTAVFTRATKELKSVSNTLKKYNIGHTIRVNESENDKPKTYCFGNSPSKYTLMVLHANKGLQFDNVIIFDWNEGEKENEEDLGLLYVAVARASLGAYIVKNELLERPMGALWLPEICIKQNEWLELLV